MSSLQVTQWNELVFWLDDISHSIPLVHKEELSQMDILAAVIKGQSIDLAKNVKREKAKREKYEREYAEAVKFAHEVMDMRRKARDATQQLI